MMTTVKTDQEIAVMREGGRMVAMVLDLMKRKCRVGLTPKDMAAMARQEIARLGGEPTCLGYHGFPDVICISVNDQVQHTIPTDRPFAAGDIVNFDFVVTYKGLVTDAGLTICVGGQPSTDDARLLKGTEQALRDGIAVVRAGCHVGDISAAIERTLRK